MSNEYHGNIMIYLWMKCEDLIDLDTYYDEMGGMIEYSEFKWRTQTYWHIACLCWFISVNEAVIFEIQPLLDAQQRRRVREPPACTFKIKPNQYSCKTSVGSS